MSKTPLTILLVAAAALAGCDQSDHNIVAEGPYDPRANLANDAAPVVMPPSIVASHTYRCKDNTVVAIDWMTDGKTNTARATPKGGTAITLAQAEAGGAYAAQASSLTGDPQNKPITYNGKSCTSSPTTNENPRSAPGVFLWGRARYRPAHDHPANRCRSRLLARRI